MLHSGTSLVVQWLRLCDSNAGSAGSIPGWGSKILHVLQCGKKKKKETASSSWSGWNWKVSLGGDGQEAGTSLLASHLDFESVSPSVHVRVKPLLCHG